MAYTEKFQQLADEACSRVEGVSSDKVDDFLNIGAAALDIRDSEEHKAGHIAGSINISRGKPEMLVESEIPDLATTLFVLLQCCEPWCFVSRHVAWDGLC